MKALSLPLIQKGSSGSRVCGFCLRQIQRRYAATATARAATTEPPTDAPAQKRPDTKVATDPRQAYNIRAGIVLSRPPLITRDLTQFEKSFYLYQRRLNERLALNFSRYFYFPRDTQQEREWKRKIKERVTPARDIGGYQAHGKTPWNDELLVGEKASEPDHQWKALIDDAAVEVEEDDHESAGGEKRVIRQEIEQPASRVTEADRSGDTKSLDRALQRTLYLLVKSKDGKWEFPATNPVGKESLHRAAERLLVEGAGPNMNTWLIARHPIGWHQNNYQEPAPEAEESFTRLGEKTFFLKGRIMAGQANLAQNKLGFTDFKWLSKDEVEKEVDPAYWRSVKNMLVTL